MFTQVCPQCNKERNVSRTMLCHVKSGRSTGKCKPCSAIWSDETRKKMLPIITGRKWKFESRKKIQGKKHYRWIADRELLKVSEKKHLDTKYKYWMLAVKKRDSWNCKMNNEDCSGALHAHHILRWSEHPNLRYDVNNGITLCKYHHPIKKEKEVALATYFINLLELETC